MSSVKQLDKGAISEVKLKRSPTVNRIQKKTESLMTSTRRRIRDSQNKENKNFEKPPQPKIN